MALHGISDDFDLDDHGILRDSFASDFHVDDDGILHDDLDLFKHAINTAGHGTDSGIGGDKQSSTSTLQHLHASFDDDLAPIGDESINISDFEASRDDLDSINGDLDGSKRPRSRGYRSSTRELETPGSTLERPLDSRQEYGSSVSRNSHQKREKFAGDQDLFSEDYYQQLRELGVLVDGTDFSRDESQTEFEALESHLSREQADYDDDNRDLIHEYLQDEYDRERAEEEEYGEVTEGRDGRSQSHIGASSRANSAPTISEQSFPEISPEDAELMYSQSHQMGEDDEMYLINNRLVPSSSRIQAQRLPGTPSEPVSRPDSRTGRPQSPHTPKRQWKSRSRRSPSPADDQDQEPHRSRSETPHRARSDSVGSHASERAWPQSAVSGPEKSALSKAHSQESFFEHDKQQNKSGDKMPKRMLPTPSASDINQSFRVKSKSKSSSNISSKATPIKPTHSISEVTRTMDDSGDGGSEVEPPSDDRSLDKSEGELTTQLKQESSKRQQATELVQQLQKEYDSLLSKYALAELTIDQMRLGARITLHADSPTPATAQPGGVPSGPVGQKAQMMQLPTPAAQRAVSGHFSAGTDGQSHSSAQVQTSDTQSHSVSRGDNAVVGGHGSVETEDRVRSKTPKTAETVKLGLQDQAASLNDRLDQFHNLLENQQLTLEEQDKAFENIRTDHEKLRRSYLQAKEDYNVLRRSGASMPDADFDNDKELEGQLFRLGMKFDEVHEMVDSNLKEQSTARLPFHTSHLADEEDHVDGEDQSEEHSGDPDTQSGAATTSEDAAYQKRAEQLHDEYRALMDRYRRLKQMTPTPEMEKETDNLVRKLNEICTEMPEVFRLAPELEQRYARLHRRDQRRSPLLRSGDQGAAGAASQGEASGPPSVPASPKARGLPLVGDHTISPYLSSRQRAQDVRSDEGYHRAPSSLTASPSSLASPADPNASPAVFGSSATPSPQARDGALSPSSQEGAAAPRDGYDPRIRRPHRHQHDFQGPKLNKMADRGSYSSLPDSGISDQDGRERHHDDALAHLPGPGKLKQLTHQRGDNDMDSGFIGSVVSTDGAHHPARDRQPERPLRLRDRAPGDRNQNRSRLDTSDSSTAGSTHREPGSGRRTRNAKLPTLVPALVGIKQDSVDRSYDGELDESTISDTHQQPSRSSDRRQKAPSSQRSDGGRRQVQRGGEGDGMTVHSHRSQPQSRTMHGNAVAEDASDGEATEVSTPRHNQSQDDPGLQRPPSQQSLHTSYCPPTPHQPPTPHRPPTPYRSQHGEQAATEERLPQQQEMVGSARMRARRPDEEELVQTRMQQRRSKSPAPVPVPQVSQRPQSRGEPTTDLYHTRLAGERSRERSREREKALSARSAGVRPVSQYGRRGSEVSEHTRGEERGVASDVEIRSDATRGSSVNSARLQALQDEIEKLKEGVKLAHDKATARQPPPQQPPPPQQEGPEYYDPFDDPYGFMRVPRRRANSYSGGRVHDYDWTLPNERQYDDGDIPLGYAAADAYNHHRRDKTPEATRHRLRRRGDRHRQEEETHPKTVDDGRAGNEGGVLVGGAGVRLPSANPVTLPTSALPAQAPSRVRRPPVTDPQALYDYYLPSRQGAQQEYPVAQPSTNPYRQHANPLSASQPNLAGTLSGVEPAPVQYQTQAKQPWYTIRRSQWPATSTAQYYPTLGAQKRGVRTQPAAVMQQPVQQGYYPTYAAAPASVPAQSGVGYKVDSCPLCGGAGAHIHEEDVEPVHGYAAQDFATQPGFQYYHTRIRRYRRYRRHEHQSRPRQRSRSASRSRHYTPERSSSRSRYLVREFGDNISDDSDHEITRGRRRSRSLSRSRGHSSETRSSSARSSSRQRGRRYRRSVDLYDSDEDVDLNESLGLSEDINRLTRRMIGTVRGELHRHRDRKEFGSSYW